MRILIATVAATLLTAAAAAGVALRSTPAQPAKAEARPERAVPGLVWRSGTATLRLTDRRCPFEELSTQLEVEGVSSALAYEVQQGARKHTGCWAKDVGGDVITLEPGQELGQIPIDWFRSEGA